MIPKLVDILIKIFAFAFTPFSKWHIVVQFIEMGGHFWHHETDAAFIGDGILDAAYQELLTTTTFGFAIIVTMHICYGEKMRKAMRRSRIMPMVDESKLIKWGRRIILLTRH
jgi:hypothetical protein